MELNCPLRYLVPQVEALQLLGAAFRVGKEQAAPLAAALKPQSAALAAALSGAITGPFKNKDHHTMALKAVCTAAEGFRKLVPQDKRLADVIGAWVFAWFRALFSGLHAWTRACAMLLWLAVCCVSVCAHSRGNACSRWSRSFAPPVCL